jgi:hypothetical protein
MFLPEPVQRDHYGQWFHSALNALEEEKLITDLPEAQGMEFCYVSFEGDAPDELQKRYYSCIASSDVDDEVWMSAAREWEPTRPKGDCWFLLAIYDTEDGPFACFTRPYLDRGKHRLKLVDFDEKTGVAKAKCRCGHERTRQAAIMCEVPGAAEKLTD